MEQNHKLDPEVSPTPAEHRLLRKSEIATVMQIVRERADFSDYFLERLKQQLELAGVVPHAPQENTKK